MKSINIIAFVLLAIFGVLAVTSMWNDSANYDERIHLPAGYSYLTQKDMRLNPEHPPLVKDLAAFPLLFMGLNFPSQSWGWNTQLTTDPSRTPSWQTDVAFGNDLLYYSGNDAQNMMRAGRIPVILLGILLGFYLFRFTRELWGNSTGLLALTFYSFSPTILAHTRLVTTDVAAATAFFISFYYFYHWLKAPTARNMIIFGIALGLGLLMKFSAFLMIPMFGLSLLIWIFVKGEKKWFWFWKYTWSFAMVLVVALLVIGVIYTYHIWDYPMEKQVIDTTFILSTYGFRLPVNLAIWLSGQPLLRPWGEYLLGFLMVVQRSDGGNTTYYLGDVSAGGSPFYFPIVYLIKEPLPYILLTFFALFLVLKKMSEYYKESRVGKRFSDLVELLKNHPAETGMIIVIVVYWIFSLRSHLNIGVRHILPTLPFIYALTARQINNWIRGGLVERIVEYKGFWQLLGLYWGRIKRGALVVIFLIWSTLSVISLWPSFLTYFNEIAGGPNNGYKFVVDSNLDWGQDILRLSQFIEKNNIQNIKMDYFSGAPAEYYIKTAKIESYDREKSQTGWLAVSATLLEGACKGGSPNCQGADRAYTWIDSIKPVAKIGYSIFIYDLK